MIFGIIKDGVRSAFVRIVRLIVYILIGCAIFYLIGLLTSNKASALVYKGTIDTPYTTQVITEGTITAGTRQVSIPYELQTPISPNADLLGFQIVNFGIRPFGLSSQTICNPTQSNNLVTYTCSGSPDFDNYFIESPYFTFYGYITYTDETIGRCYTSNDYNDYLLCPVFKSTPIKKITIRINTVESIANLMYHLNLSMSNALFNYESTEIINSNGTIVNQQQQTNTILDNFNNYTQNNNTTQSETQATTDLTGISGQFNDLLNGWGGEWSSLTHVILEPLNVMLYAFEDSTTCQPIVLNVPYMENKQILLPCMSGIYNQYFGPLIAIFITIMSGLFAYRTIMKIIQTIKEVLDAENDKIEVIDL